MKIRFFANFVLTAGGTIALLTLCYYLYGYGVGQQQSTSAPWTVRNTALAGVATLLFASLRLRPVLKTAVAGLFISLTAVLYTAELVLAGWNSRLVAPDMPMWGIDRASQERKKEIASFAQGLGVEINTKDRIEVLDDLRQRSVDAVPAVMLADILGGDGTVRLSESINVDELQPLGGISSALTVLCNQSGQYVTYRSDEHGFRNPAGIWSSSGADLAAVGQSFAQGYCVPDGKGFVDLLRTQHPVTINLGMSGESSLLQLAAIREYLPRYAPKIVLWIFSEGIDLLYLYEESKSPHAMRYLEPTFSQHLLTRQPEIDNAWRRSVAEQERRARETRSIARGSSFVATSLGILKLWKLRTKLDLVYGISSDAEPWSMVQQQTTRSLLSQILSQAQTETRSWGGTLYFVYLPSWTRYRNGPRVSERERTSVLSLVTALGIPVIDIQPAFEAQHDPLSLFPFRRFGHYNEAGNQIVAGKILSFLSAHEQSQPFETRGIRR